MTLGTALRLLLIANELVQVFYQVVELGHLNVVLDDVAWVEEADRFDVLLDGVIVLFLVEKFVGVLFYYLALDLSREVCFFGNCLRFSVV